MTVIDIGSKDFRDPKVQWYAPTKSWRMTVSMSTEREGRSTGPRTWQRSWKLQSEFGPAGATGGVWECPGSVPLAVDGDKRIKSVS